jgi:hypothetical protein
VDNNACTGRISNAANVAENTFFKTLLLGTADGSEPSKLDFVLIAKLFKEFKPLATFDAFRKVVIACSSVWLTSLIIDLANDKNAAHVSFTALDSTTSVVCDRTVVT